MSDEKKTNIERNLYLQDQWDAKKDLGDYEDEKNNRDSLEPLKKKIWRVFI